MGEDAVQAEKSSMVVTHQSQDLVVPSPSPTHSSPTQSLSRMPGGISVEEAALVAKKTPGNQVNAITVLTLLDKLVNMLDTVQENQQKMEIQQLEMENAVRGIQNDMTKLSKSHTSTSNTVSKLLEKSRKVSVHMKEVRDKMDKQAVQVKKLEANHAHLLKRNNFKVLIFQEENEIPPSAFVKEPVPYPHEPEEDVPNVDANRSQEEGLQTINLSSDEELGPDEEDDEAGLGLELTDESMQKSRAEKFKRSSLKKVDSLKKAFSRQNIEKKMTKISTKIVSPEKREKLKKSFSSSQQKSTSSSIKVSPLFSVKKEQDSEACSNTEGLSTAMASIELAPIQSLDENLPFNEVHSNLAPVLEENKSTADSLKKEELVNVSTGCLDAELRITEDENPAYSLSATLPQEDPIPAASSTLQQLIEEQEEEDERKETLYREKRSYVEE